MCRDSGFIEVSGGPAGVRGSIFRRLLLGRTAPPAAAPRRFYLRGFIQRDADLFLLARLFFGGMGYYGQKTTNFTETQVLSALPLRRRRQKNICFLENVWFLGLDTPGITKNTWPKKHVGILLTDALPHCGMVFDTETFWVVAGSLGLCRFSGSLVVFLVFPAGGPTFPAPF